MLPLVLLGVVNGLVPYLNYRIGIDLFNPAVAFWALVLQSVFPWPVQYSMGLWNIHYLAIFIPLMLWSYLRYCRTKNSRYYYAWVVSFCLGVHFHLLVLFLVPFFGLHKFLSRTELPYKHWAGGLLLVLALFSPYLVLDARHGFQNTKGLLFPYEERYWAPQSLKLFSSPIIVSSIEISRLLSESTFKVTADTAAPIKSAHEQSVTAFEKITEFYQRYFGHAILGLLLVGSNLIFTLSGYLLYLRRDLRRFNPLARATYRSQLGRDYATARQLFLTLWLWVPLGLFLLSGKAFELRYAILWWPLGFFILGCFIDDLYRWAMSPPTHESKRRSLTGVPLKSLGRHCRHLWHQHRKKAVTGWITVNLLAGGYTSLVYPLHLHAQMSATTYPVPTIVVLDRLADALVEESQSCEFDVVYPPSAGSRGKTGRGYLDRLLFAKYGRRLNPAATLKYRIVPIGEDSGDAKKV